MPLLILALTGITGAFAQNAPPPPPPPTATAAAPSATVLHNPVATTVTAPPPPTPTASEAIELKNAWKHAPRGKNCNILPFPALDGGRIFFLIAEAVRGRAVNRKIEIVTHNIGFILLMMLVLVVTYRDVVRFGDRIWSAVTSLFGLTI